VVELERVGLPAAMVFPDWSGELLKAEPEATAPLFYDGKEQAIIVAMQSFLLKTRHHIILIDTCIGNDKERNNPHFNRLHIPWLERLAATGVQPGDVDFVLCTHMHVDHVGWNTRLENGRWVPTFPKARYIFAKQEWEHWERMSRENQLERTGDYVADSVLPIVEAGRADLVSTDHEIETGIWLDHLPGHTPGLVGIHVKNSGGEAVFCGDMMHHPVQVARPNMSTNFDTDQKQAAETRRRFLENTCGTNILVVPAHFPGATSGYVQKRDAKSFKFKFD
jgi:glyoxylase-like metal-dependent hydrolase (beta-lactamase superfamily II)